MACSGGCFNKVGQLVVEGGYYSVREDQKQPCMAVLAVVLVTLDQKKLTIKLWQGLFTEKLVVSEHFSGQMRSKVDDDGGYGGGNHHACNINTTFRPFWLRVEVGERGGDWLENGRNNGCL